jgi:hypothetical protein
MTVILGVSMQPASVQALCNTMARAKLFTPEDIRALFQRWQSEAKQHADDLDHFYKWLAFREYLTDFQVNLLRKGLGGNPETTPPSATSSQ